MPREVKPMINNSIRIKSRFFINPIALTKYDIIIADLTNINQAYNGFLNHDKK